MMRNTMFFLFIVLTLGITSHCIANAERKEPTLAIPIRYMYAQQEPLDEDLKVRVAALRQAILDIPVSKVLLHGIMYQDKFLTQLALQADALEYVDTPELYKAVSAVMQTNRIVCHLLLGIPVTIPLSLAAALEYNRTNSAAPAVITAVTLALLHGGMEGLLYIDRKLSLQCISILAAHGAFTNPRHAAVNHQLQQLILKTYGKRSLQQAVEQWKKTQQSNTPHR